MKTRSIKAAVASALLLTSLSMAQAADTTATDSFTGNISGYLVRNHSMTRTGVNWIARDRWV